MFIGVLPFNQPIGDWNASAVTTDVTCTFHSASNFQPTHWELGYFIGNRHARYVSSMRHLSTKILEVGILHRLEHFGPCSIVQLHSTKHIGDWDTSSALH